MKKLLLAAALCAGVAPAARAQSTAFKVNVLSPIVRTGSVSVEHSLGAHRSVQLEALYTRWNSANLLFENRTAIKGFALVPEYREYLSPSQGPLQGVYLATFFRFRHLNLETDYHEFSNNSFSTALLPATLTTYGGGVAVGYQRLFKQRFSLDVYLGPSFDVGEVQEASNLPTRAQADASMYQGFKVRSGITFGIVL